MYENSWNRKWMPSLVVTNDMLSEFLDTSDEWIVTRTGIKTRRIISTENLVMLATDAANKALEKAGLSPLDIDYIICSNTANNYVTPSLSSIIQGEIKAQAPCIDINGACTGFINGLAIANALTAGNKDNLLLLLRAHPLCNWQGVIHVFFKLTVLQRLSLRLECSENHSPPLIPMFSIRHSRTNIPQ